MARILPFLTALALELDVGFRFYESCNALAEFAFDILQGDFGVFDRVVKCCRGQKFLVVRHGGCDRDCLHRVNDVREPLPFAFGSLMGLYRKNNRLVKN